MKKKGRRPKRIAYELIPRQSDSGRRMYALLEELVEAHHEDLVGAAIALAWNLTWKPDVDGRVTLGKCKKASDLDRELAPFDVVILLRRDFWTHPTVTDPQRRALLDHELMHACVAHDETGEPTVDEKGRTVYRIRKHDLEEFVDIVARHGLYKRDLEQFAAALRPHVPAFTPCVLCEESPGWVPVTDGGVTRVARCACWREWANRRQDHARPGRGPSGALHDHHTQ